MGTSCITSWPISWVSPLLLFFHLSHSPRLSTSRSSPNGSQEWNGSFLEKNPLFTHFCTQMISWGVWIINAHLELLLPHHLNRPESHQWSPCHFKAFVWKSIKINFLNSFNLTGGEWQLFLFPIPDWPFGDLGTRHILLFGALFFCFLLSKISSKWKRLSSMNSHWKTEVWLVWSLGVSGLMYQNESFVFLEV